MTPAGGSEADALCNAHQLRLWDSAVAVGLAETAPREMKQRAKFNVPAPRMWRRSTDYLRFAFDERVTFDNNAAESEVCMAGIQ